MESPRKFNDCYFYYYSTCIKGDNCVFRHEPSALGCETMCTAWQQGKCLDKRCKLRHMELRKNRKQIPCYWENQPGGCRKKHCPFMHKNPDARTDGIAPSQPAPVVVATPAVPEAPVEQPTINPNVAPPVAAPASVPLLWQQQRQVVLDSAILGVLPASSELLGARRVLPPHAHAHAHPHEAPNPYAPLPVDSLVVNFEDESDNESPTSSTPTKTINSEDGHKTPRSKSQELLLLERIQAEAAAFYSYDEEKPAVDQTKIIRTNLTSKYDRLSLDELAGKKQNSECQNSLDFKVLSLDEIRARKKGSESNVLAMCATVKLNLRKRKLSTQEINTTTGNKMIKVIRSNSIVYKKVDKNAPQQLSQTRTVGKRIETANTKRTLSEQSDMCDTHELELIDDCYEFKRIRISEPTSKPRLIRNRHTSTSNSESKDDIDCEHPDFDTEVEFITEIKDTHIDKLSDSEIIDVDSVRMGDPVAVVDLCEDVEEDNTSDLELDLIKNVPDVVASCRKNKNEVSNKDLLENIDSFLDDS